MLHSTPIQRVIEQTAVSGGLLGTVSERFGLMPTTAPTARLPEWLCFIDECIAELPVLLRLGRVCKRLMELPAAKEDELRRLDHAEMLRLSMAYGFLAYSFRYAWEHGRERLLHDGEAWCNATVANQEDRLAPTGGTIARIRANILLPWRKLGQIMGRDQPCFEAEFFTRNFRVLDGVYRGAESVGQDSCELLFRIFANETERAFFLGVQEVTARFHCVPALVRMQRAMAQREHDGVVAAVDEITLLWREVVEDVFMRFDTRIDPTEWAATVGTWTASPFPGRDGFSGMFFPAFHMLDVLLGRVRYASTMGKLIAHTRGELLPAWRDLFAAIGEADLRTYCDAHRHDHPELVRALFRLQDAYQHFFLVHRRKVFAFEYQGIVTGRNSTNAGIAVDIRDRSVESVHALATWNEIDRLLLDSGTERPLERFSPGGCCPFSGPLAEDAPKDFPSPVGTRCPFGAGAPAPSLPEPEPESGLPSWRPLPTASDLEVYEIEVKSLPVPPQVGDRAALWLDADGTQKVEGDFVGPMRAPYVIRTARPLQQVHRIELVRGLFARMPGAGAQSRRTREAPVLVIAEGRHSVLATTLTPHVRAEFFVLIEGQPQERKILEDRGVSRSAICLVESLESLSVEAASEACGHSPSALRALRDRVLIYISGTPRFVKRANAWLESAFLEPHEPVTAFLSELRLSKRYRPIVQQGPSACDEKAVMYPWDVIGARRYPLRVVLNGRVLDLTQFQAVHYGGTPILRMLAGTDVSAEFSRAHPAEQVRMPDVHAVASFCVPVGLKKVTQLAFLVARSANVLGLLDDALGPYPADARPRTQRVCRVLETLDVETLWSSALANACGAQIEPAVQNALRANHARSLAVLESTLRSTERTDLSSSFAAQYADLYDDVLQNLVRGLRESVPKLGRPIDKAALTRCFRRHIQILLERSATRVPHESSERVFQREAERVAATPKPVAASY